MNLKFGDIVWNGTAGGTDNRSEYSIRVENLSLLKEQGRGCWCPKEAVPYLQAIGINAGPSPHYDSGYSAPGCYWLSRSISIETYIQQAYDSISINKNKFFSRGLTKLED